MENAALLQDTRASALSCKCLHERCCNLLGRHWPLSAHSARATTAEHRVEDAADPAGCDKASRMHDVSAFLSIVA